jgi:predicted RNA polymerase sigma factor
VLASEPTIQLLKESSTEAAALSTEFSDERLKLLFVCAHPAIDPAMHTPLMLQTVLGLDASRIGQAFLIAPKTMGQRLFRAKTKIRSGGIPFEMPQERDLSERLEAVMEAISPCSGSVGMTWRAATSAGATSPRKAFGSRGSFCSSCPAKAKFKVC